MIEKDLLKAILNCFEVGEPELNVRDIAERTGLHKSTAHRILMALQHNGFVEQDAASGRYHLGLQLVKLGEHAVHHPRLLNGQVDVAGSAAGRDRPREVRSRAGARTSRGKRGTMGVARW